MRISKIIGMTDTDSGVKYWMESPRLAIVAGKVESSVDKAVDALESVRIKASSRSLAYISSGTVTAVAEGSATITAKAGDKSATCTVTVKKNGLNAGDPEGFNNENGEW